MTGNQSGVLVLNKPSGITSHDAVSRIRKLYGTRQVGHTGTLDPDATGVLVVMVGRAVKASEFIVSDDKEYAAGLKLGLTTDTEDISGKILTSFEGELPSREQVKNAVNAFVGVTEQIPPMYSALKVGGRKLVDLARKGIETERAPRKITVYRASVYATDRYNEYLLAVKVSKGTYIRTLCADIGKKLGVGAVMSSLTRICSGNFGLEDAVTFEMLENMSEEERARLLLPVESLFDDCESVLLPDFFAGLAGNGCQIYQKKIGTSFCDGEYVRLYDRDGFFALGQVKEYPEGSAIKPVKQFRI